MKIRARRAVRNSKYDEEDFLLKEFSQDMEKFVLDSELSCNECQETEDLDQPIDSPLSFLIKMKAHNVSDPKAIAGGVAGFVLPEDLKYRVDHLPESKSVFRSVRENHHVALMDETQQRALSTAIHAASSDHKEYDSNAIDSYLLGAYQQPEWDTLLSDTKKKKWLKRVGRAHKAELIKAFGAIDNKNIIDGLDIDPEGYRRQVEVIKKCRGFDDKELKAMKKAGL